ncbi:bifunctional oligoribonuclease/PAP phosphatase NrnA [Candidatus Omnitrophota bacterium]
MSKGKVIQAIKRHSNFLISSHVGLEGDALGSELALASLLGKLGKRALIINNDAVPANYSFLAKAKQALAIGSLGKETLRKIRNNYFQAAIILDCSQKHRIGKVISLIDHLPVINIDHHLDNKGFGQINWIDPGASSAGEMVYHLFAQAKLCLDKDDALNLFTAISTDTGFFRHANATSATFHICAELVKLGVSPAEIYSRVYEDNSAQQAGYLGKIISRMRFVAGKQIAWTEIRPAEFSKISGKHEVMDRVLDFARSIKTVQVAIIFSQVNKDLIKVSLRSKPPVNVQKIALSFGGGGHRCAAGCVLQGGMKQAVEIILKHTRRILR